VLPRGVDDLAVEELRALGASDLRPTSGGVAFTGDLAVAYRVLLWSRLASRLLLPLWRVDAHSSHAFYDAVRALPWEGELRRGATFAIDAHARGDRAVHTHFVALRTKDAVVDRLRERWGERPDVDLDDPELRLHVLLEGGHSGRDATAQLSLDLSGEPLHRRGYRGASGPAPLKENVAAALLLRAGWPAIAAAGGGFVDPMCGAGTLLVEAALLATDAAPGLLRTGNAASFGLRGWRGHDRRAWESLRAEAERRRQAGRARLPPMGGSDRDGGALEAARASLAAAGGQAAQDRPPVQPVGQDHGPGVPDPVVVAVGVAAPHRRQPRASCLPPRLGLGALRVPQATVMAPPAAKTKARSVASAQQPGRRIGRQQCRLDEQRAGAAHRVGEATAGRGDRGPAGAQQQRRGDVLLERRRPARAAVAAAVERLAGEVERQLRRRITPGLTALEQDVEAQLRIVEVDVRALSPPFAQPVDDGILGAQRHEVGVDGAVAARVGVNGESGATPQLPLPRQRPHGVVERVRRMRVDAPERQQQPAREARPEQHPIGDREVAGERHSARGGAQFGGAEGA